MREKITYIADFNGGEEECAEKHTALLIEELAKLVGIGRLRDINLKGLALDIILNKRDAIVILEKMIKILKEKDGEPSGVKFVQR